MKRLFPSILLAFSLIACSKQKDTLKVGVTGGPHAVIAEFVQKKAKEKGLNAELVTFDDFIQPNVALEAGDIDVNIYQHEPFLKEQMNSRGYKNFVVVGKAILLPLAIYGADHIKSIKDVKSDAKVLIPSDPTNAARALRLLEKAGLIKLINHINPTPKDLAENPLNLKIIEVEAPLIPRLLKDDADIAVINADWVIASGMDPAKALLKEEAKDSPYTNLIVAKKENQSRPDLKKFVELYHGDDVKKLIQDTFKGAVLPAW